MAKAESILSPMSFLLHYDSPFLLQNTLIGVCTLCLRPITIEGKTKMIGHTVWVAAGNYCSNYTSIKPYETSTHAYLNSLHAKKHHKSCNSNES